VFIGDTPTRCVIGFLDHPGKLRPTRQIESKTPGILLDVQKARENGRLTSRYTDTTLIEGGSRNQEEGTSRLDRAIYYKSSCNFLIDSVVLHFVARAPLWACLVVSR